MVHRIYLRLELEDPRKRLGRGQRRKRQGQRLRRWGRRRGRWLRWRRRGRAGCMVALIVAVIHISVPMVTLNGGKSVVEGALPAVALREASKKVSKGINALLRPMRMMARRRRTDGRRARPRDGRKHGTHPLDVLQACRRRSVPYQVRRIRLVELCAALGEFIGCAAIHFPHRRSCKPLIGPDIDQLSVAPFTEVVAGIAASWLRA